MGWLVGLSGVCVCGGRHTHKLDTGVNFSRRSTVMNTRATRRFFSPAVASWYVDTGTTGCGFHTTYGIATLLATVTCGDRVRLRYGNRTVTATRDDSGPYVAGRTFDLNPTTRAALRCPDICNLTYRILPHRR